MNYRPVVIICVLALIAITSCETPTAAIVQGNISGRVYLQQLKGKTDQDNHAVSLNLAGNKSYSTTSADSGKFVLTGVEQGIYSLTYSKTGYTPYTMDNIQFVGNGTLKLYTVTLNEIDTIVHIPDTNKNDPKVYDRRCFGYVKLYDENGDSLDDHSGVTVSINGTNVNSTSDKSGIFYFVKYPAGAFTVTLSKEGFQSTAIPEIYFPDSNTLTSKKQIVFQGENHVELVKPPNLQVVMDGVSTGHSGSYYSISTNQDGSHDTSLTIEYSYHVTPAGYGKQVWCLVIIGDSVNISNENYSYKNTADWGALLNPKREDRGAKDFRTGKYEATRWHIEHSGRPVYFRAYVLWGRTGNNLQHFEDPITRRFIFSGYTASPVMSFTLPTVFK